jgi:hypothetical protein
MMQPGQKKDIEMTERDIHMVNFSNYLKNLDIDRCKTVFCDLVSYRSEKWDLMGPKLQRLLSEGQLKEAKEFVDDAEFKELDAMIDLAIHIAFGDRISA